MAGELLLDTGALICLLDRSQKRHQAFVEFFQGWTEEVVTTEAVLTESTHLLSRVSGGALACVDFVLSGGAIVVPLGLPALKRARELMMQYQDCPMDFADASLVVLAEDLGTGVVLTTDHKDFGNYRIRGRRRFTVPV